MAIYRSDLRTEIRDNIAEATGVANAIWSDALLNRHIAREIKSLPTKNIYLEENWTASETENQRDYGLPPKCKKLEKLERNESTTAVADWQEIKGWEVYGTTLRLAYWPSSNVKTLRGYFRISFVNPDDDITALDLPDDICELVVWGVTIRCYSILIGYLRGSRSWDSVTKPGDLSIPVIISWLREAKQTYKELVGQYATNPRPRDINLVA